MKYLSVGLIALQFIIALVGGVYVLQILFPPLGGFDSRFLNAQLIRTLAIFLPYFGLLVSIFVSILFHTKKRYLYGIASVFVLIFGTYLLGQSILKTIPDPIQENFGARAEPYTGFLVLPKEAIPEGFIETEHKYTKRHYSAQYKNDRGVQFGISQDDNAAFSHSKSKLIREFEYQGVKGHIYHYNPDDKEREALSLIWLYPPKQRTYIWVEEYPLSAEYTPEFLIHILESMKEKHD